MATIKQIKDTEGNIHDILSTIGYGTCGTAAATAAKVATIDDTSWTLKVGSIIGIKYTYSNTAGSSTTPVTLNVNSTGAKNIWYNNAKFTGTNTNICGYANRVTYYMYDGTYWVWLNTGSLDGNTDTVPCIQIETAAGTAEKIGTCTNYSLLAKSYAHANVRYSNSAQSALTLNVNSKGAKPIYINGTASSASNYTLPAGTYIIYYDGTNYHFRTDGILPGKVEYAERAGYAKNAESCDNAIMSNLAIGDENGNNISSTYLKRSDFDSLAYRVDLISSDFNYFAEYVEETYSKTMLSLNHSQLVNLRDSGRLIPGQQYRITNYVTTVSTALNEISAGHQFDIIVTADSENILNEEARAIQHDNDTYFNSSNLSAWKIWYSLDNDEDRFNWAREDGYGVIYRMIDEYGNDCPYDFKNIQFKVDDKYFYTFTFVESSNLNGPVSSNLNGPVFDISCKNSSYSGSVYNNVINRYISNDIQYLNNITFISYASISVSGETIFGYNFYNNTFGRDCYFNTFGNNCYNNTFGRNCYSNTFGNGCYSNTFSNNCYNNTFGRDCYSNTFGNNCYNNKFSNGCYSNTFSNNCQSNTFGNYCYDNAFGSSCSSNTFDSSCSSNTFGNSCSSNTFKKNCQSNTFFDWCGSSTLDGTTFEGNEFQDGCKYNLFGVYCRANKFSKTCRNNTFGNHCVGNEFGESCTSNDFKIGCDYNNFGGGCESNILDIYCSGNTFGDYCCSNTFGNYCKSNKFGNECQSNTFGDNCQSNTFANKCYFNTFGNYCHTNIFGTVNSNNEFDSNAGSCSRNKFGTNCYNNKLFNTCNNNSFDIDCHDNEFGASCTYNKFDTLCAVIKFGSNCSYITLGNGCTNITFGTSSAIRSYYRRITIDSGNRYIYLNCGTSGSSRYYQNVRIGLGVNNTSTYKTIADGNINQTFETYYKPSESQTILI